MRKENDKEILAVFSSQKVNTSDEKFEGASISCVFGGVSLDLREAKITSDIVINATSVFGGIDILVSDNVNVKVESLNSVFSIIDFTTDKIAFFTDKIVEVTSNLIGKLFGKKKERDE